MLIHAIIMLTSPRKSLARTTPYRASRLLVAKALALEAGQAMLDAKARCARQGRWGRVGAGGGVSYKGRHDL